jgi:hypothetical protein
MAADTDGKLGGQNEMAADIDDGLREQHANNKEKRHLS